MLALPACAADPMADLPGDWRGACSPDPAFSRVSGELAARLHPGGEVTGLSGIRRWQLDGDRLVLSGGTGDLGGAPVSGQYAFAGSVLRLNAVTGLATDRDGAGVDAGPRWCNLVRGDG